jgi:hypothetical protein
MQEPRDLEKNRSTKNLDHRRQPKLGRFYLMVQFIYLFICYYYLKNYIQHPLYGPR